MSANLTNAEVIVLLGEAGVGKTTLVAALQSQDGPRAQGGLFGTERPKMYAARDTSSSGRARNFLDTVGVGGEISVKDMVAALEVALGSTKIHGIVFCHKANNSRVTMGANFVQAVIDKGMMRINHEWENVILCGTHSDEAKPDQINHFRTEMKRKFNNLITTTTRITKVVVVGHGNHNELLEALNQLNGNTMKYEPPPPSELIKHLKEMTNLTEEQLEREIVASREVGFWSEVQDGVEDLCTSMFHRPSGDRSRSPDRSPNVSGSCCHIADDGF